MWPHGCSGRRRPRPPARLGVLTAFGAAPRSPPVPSGPSGALHTSGAWCADGWLGASSRSPARPRRRPCAPQLGAVGEVVRWFETVVAFARLCLCGVETAIACAGVKWAFLLQFGGAEVMAVSEFPCWGRAVVLLVSMSLRCRAVCAKFFPLRGSVHRACAKKFALQAQNGRKMLFSGVLGELFRGNAAGGAVLGEFFSRQSPLRPGLVGDVAHEAGCGGDFAVLEAGWRRVAGVSYL